MGLLKVGVFIIMAPKCTGKDFKNEKAGRKCSIFCHQTSKIVSNFPELIPIPFFFFFLLGHWSLKCCLIKRKDCSLEMEAFIFL